MNIYRYLLIVAVFSIVSAFSYRAHSHDHIPFLITNNSSYSVCISCSGPWLRSFGCPLIKDQYNIAPGTLDYKYYSAEVDIFSPYGSWCCTCYSSIPCPTCGIGEATCGFLDFNLKKDDTAVYVTVNADNSLTITLNGISETSNAPANVGSESDTSTTVGSLGDDNTKPKRDTDTWSIQGTTGETVTLTLEEDNEAGHTGEQATLILRSGGSDIESRIDALPIEITTTLPSDGEYQLVVQQQGIPEDLRFRGNYYLSVKSDTGEIQEIKPSTDVEQ